MTTATASKTASLCPAWRRFLLDALGGDHAEVERLRRALGYSATGGVGEHKAFLVVGPPESGKTTFARAVAAAMGGDLACLWVDDSRSRSVDALTLAGLQGRQIVFIETRIDGRWMRPANLYMLLSGNPIWARKPYRDFYQFAPTHHLWAILDQEPDPARMAAGMGRRLETFRFRPPTGKPSATLGHRLAAEVDGIREWISEGAEAWRKAGL